MRMAKHKASNLKLLDDFLGTVKAFLNTSAPPKKAGKAAKAKAMLTGVTWSRGVPRVNLRQTTMSNPTKPSNRPSH